MAEKQGIYEVTAWRQGAVEYATGRVRAANADAAIAQVERLCADDVESLDWESWDAGDGACPPHFYRAVPVDDGFEPTDGDGAEQARTVDPDAKALLCAARECLARWERGDLAGAMRGLQTAVDVFRTA